MLYKKKKRGAILKLFLSWQCCLLATKNNNNNKKHIQTQQQPTYRLGTTSGDESRLVGNPLWLTAQWTGRDLLCGTLLIKGPCCFIPTEGINCSGTTYKRFSTACLLFSFSICGFTCSGEICLSENRAVETWNSLNVCSFCFYFEGLGSGVRSSSWGRRPGNMETSASSTKHQEKKE